MKIQKEWKKKYIGKYTLLFGILGIVILYPFWSSGTSLIWKEDGVPQYFPYLYYMGNHIRDFFSGIFQGDWVPQMFDFSIGMGEDVGAIYRSHPLDFLSALVPGRYTELLYHFLLLFRIYLAGLSFSAFCFYWKRSETVTLAGSMMYVFCGYVLIQGLRHPTFNAPMIILPLFLLGAEQILQGKNGLLFSFLTALGFISNYYFMYICSFAMAGYVLIRFFGETREQRGKMFFRMGIRLLLYYLLGIGMVASVLFPTLLRLSGSVRLEKEPTGSLLFYENGARYYQWFLNLIAPFCDTGSRTSLNYAAAALPVLASLFSCKGRNYVQMKLALVLGVVGCLFPVWGYVMSGFSEVNNRWIYVFSFVVSFCFVSAAEKLSEQNKKQKWWMLGAWAIYTILFLISGGKKNAVYWNCGWIQLTVCTAVLLWMKAKQVSEKVMQRILLLLVSVSCAVNGYYTCSSQYGNIVSEYMEYGETLAYSAQSKYAHFSNIPEEGFYRTDGNTMVSGEENASVILGYQGISMYNSVINSNLLEYLLDTESPGVNAVHRVFSMDGRAAAEVLANVKYYMAPAGETDSVPYGFTLAEELSDESYQIYANEHPLSLGYTYDSYIVREDYEKLSALEKQQVMMEAVVLEETAEGLENKTQGTQEILTVKLELPKTGNNVQKTKTGYQAGEGGGSIVLPYEKKEGYEAYLHLKGFYRNASYSFIDIRTEGMEKSIVLRGKDRAYSLGRMDYLVNLGYSEQNEYQEIEVSFRDHKKYQLEGIELCYVPLEHFEAQVDALNQEGLQNAEVTKNQVTGTAKLSKNGVMVFSIPYRAGWTAYVDGEKQELVKANVMYLGLRLEEGEHEITLRYCSPGLPAGLAVSGISTVLFLLLLLKHCRKRGNLLYKEKKVC